MIDYKTALEELRQYTVEIPENPEKSTEELSRLLSKIQSYKNRVSAMLIEALWEKVALENALAAAEASYEAEKSVLLATDSEVNSKKSADMREATVNCRLVEKLALINKATAEKALIDAYLRCVQQTYDNLDSANDNVGRQIQLLSLMKTGL